MLKKITLILFNIILIALALALASYLFIEKDFKEFFGLDIENTQMVEDSNLEVTLAGDYVFASADSLSLDPANRTLTSIIYEPLVSREFDFSLKPALALSWGQTDELSWTFKLRPNVKFHDGTDFNADTVVSNFNDMRAKPATDVAQLLRNIDKVERVSPLELKFKLKEKDPLALLRLSYFLQPAPSKAGTGFLKLTSQDTNKVRLDEFSAYWGPKYTLKRMNILQVPDPYQKLDMLNLGDVDIVSNVPKSSLISVSKLKFDSLQVPKLEIGFLLFNDTSDELRGKTKSLKDVLNFVVDRNALLNGVDENFTPIYQFAPKGISGVSAKVNLPDLDIYEGSKLLKNAFTDSSSEPLVIHYSPGLNYFAETLQTDLSGLGLGILIQELNGDDMQTSLKEGKADLYLLEWKFDMPDNSEFLKNFVVNNALYKGAGVAKLVEEAIVEDDFFVRSQKLQDIMKQVVDEAPLGFPLFEKNTNYVFSNDLAIRPNLDGSLDLQFIHQKQ